MSPKATTQVMPYHPFGKGADLECNGVNFWKNHYGCLNSSTIEETSLGGAEVKEETIKKTKHLLTFQQNLFLQEKYQITNFRCV
ncbi:MAG: hypothetical protein Ct9H300mP20_00530 [Gammaproteobacteria bacterium]|nr:MAG: hypothetical protein Ct9H300mP20_00530 [Gammaproteobacteria bacterium]